MRAVVTRTQTTTKKEKSVLRAENIDMTFDMGAVKVKAIDGISVDIKKGDYISIMGPSGSGKTTLLNIMSAMLRPTSGEVYIENKPMSKMDDNELAKVRGHTIGFIFQTFNLINRITALENVMLPLWFQGIPKQEREVIAKQKLEAVGLGDRIKHRPNELSGGQRQRVAIARALAVDPSIIVADEPTGNLDSKSGEQILEIIDRLYREEEKTIIMITHENYVAQRAEKTIHLKDGKIINTEYHKH